MLGAGTKAALRGIGMGAAGGAAAQFAYNTATNGEGGYLGATLAGAGVGAFFNRGRLRGIGKDFIAAGKQGYGAAKAKAGELASLANANRGRMAGYASEGLGRFSRIGESLNPYMRRAGALLGGLSRRQGLSNKNVSRMMSPFRSPFAGHALAGAGAGVGANLISNMITGDSGGYATAAALGGGVGYGIARYGKKAVSLLRGNKRARK